MDYRYTKPKQKIPFKQKTKKWAEECGQYYKGTCVDAVDRDQAIRHYRLANGELDERDYLYVTNPINTQKYELMGYPARLANYDIISPNIMLLMGEKARRMFPPIAYAKNSQYHIAQLEEQKKLLIRESQKLFINEVISRGVPLEEEEMTMKLEEIAQRIKNLPDELARLGQDALDYIVDFNDLFRLFRKGFYDWNCNACVYSYKDVHKDETRYEIVSPIHIAYLCSPVYDFIEDGEAIKATHIMSINEIYDRFQDDPDFSEIEEFINQYGTSTDTGLKDSPHFGASDIIRKNHQGELFRNVFGYLPEEQYADGITVEHIQWRSQMKIGKLTTFDIFGNPIEMTVSEDFKPVEGDIIEWEWVDEIWETYCIADMHYIGSRAIPIQRGKKAKLLYNGRNFSTRHTRPKSIVAKGESYQKSVNIIKYRAEQTLAKNLDKIILFPLGLIPKKEGWDEEKLMYYVRAFSFLFFDDTRQNAASMVSALKDLDMSMHQHIINAYSLVAIIKQEWNEVCGISPQRKAQIGTSAGQGVTEEAIDRSYVMSEEHFLEYEEFERREYEGMLELSKYAFSKGKQAYYTKQDGTVAFLNINDPESFLWLELGVFVRNGARELQKLDMMKAQVQAFAQNQVSPKVIKDIIESDNFAKLHIVLDDLEAKMDANRQAVQQQEMAIQESTERISQQELEYKYYDTDLDSYTSIQVALIKEGMGMVDQMKKMEENGTATSNAEVYAGIRDSFEKNSIELIKNATKLKEIAAKERMNKDNNRVALLNKTTGEK